MKIIQKLNIVTGKNNLKCLKSYVRLALAAPSGPAGGGYYGSLYEPVDLGSRGGTGTASSPGGRGGGRIHIVVLGHFILDGIINVDGKSGSRGSGGGSGGSTWIVAGQ